MRKLMSAGAGLLAAVILVAGCSTAGRSTAAATDGGGVRLGVFDSRAVTIAYVKSDLFEAYMTSLRNELAAAQVAGDGARVAELEAFGPEMQRKLHQQGFSTGSVADILEHIAKELPDIARDAGVDVIVSRWDLVYASRSADLVDVTDALVEAFGPDEKTWRSVREIVATEPVPMGHLDHDD